MMVLISVIFNKSYAESSLPAGCTMDYNSCGQSSGCSSGVHNCPVGMAPDYCGACCRFTCPAPAPTCDCTQSADNICYWGCGGYCGISCGGGNPPPPPPPPPPTYPDLVPWSIDTTDGRGNPKNVFHTGEPIYVTTTISNDGDDYTPNDSYHAIYKSSGDFNNGNESMTIISYSNWAPGIAPTYSSWNSDRYDRNYFTQSSANTYGLWVAADYTNQITEWNEDNNYLSNTYEVRAQIHGAVCWSLDEDTQCDAGDPGLADIPLTLKRDTNNNRTYKTTVGTDRTDSSGHYDFGYLAADPYSITMTNGTWRAVSSNPRVTTLGQDAYIRFAAIRTYDISGYIFIDTDRNGVKSGNETEGYAGATVILTGPNGEGGTTTTDTTGRYVFNNRKRGNYTVTLNVPSGYRAYPDKDNTRTITIPLNSTQNSWRADIGINTVYNLTGRVYVDADKSRSYDSTKDFPLANVTVNATGHEAGSDKTDAQGRYTITDLEPGDYTTRPVLPSDYIFLSSDHNYVTITDANTSGGNFRAFGKYSVSGNIFIDTNDDSRRNGDEINYATTPTIITPNLPGSTPIPFITGNPDGTYQVSGLITSSYKISYNNLPIGYVINNPRNGPPPTFTITVGSSGCTAAPTAPDGICNNGSLEKLNFAIKAGQPWWQAYGLDVRLDNGLRNPLPPSPNTACGGAYASVKSSATTPGIVFSGNVNPYFWQGSASTENWVVGNSSYPERFPDNALKTSYAYMQTVITQSSISPINLETVCSLNSCTLPANLANAVYQADGSVNLNGFTFPANKHFVFLINGNLTVNGAIHVPTTSTATFFVAGNIIVASSVGSSATCPAPAAGAGDIEGFYSTDKSFIITGTSNCSATPEVSDKQLNIQGSVVINAGQQGGVFTNNRDLCTNNVNFPTVTFKERPDMILNAPDLLHSSNYNYREAAP